MLETTTTIGVFLILGFYSILRFSKRQTNRLFLARTLLPVLLFCYIVYVSQNGFPSSGCFLGNYRLMKGYAALFYYLLVLMIMDSVWLIIKRPSGIELVELEKHPTP